MDLLVHAPSAVEELAEAASLPVANCSHHLQVLKRAGLLAARPRGTQVIYSIASDSVVELLKLVRRVAHERSRELQHVTEEYLGGEVEPVTRDELTELLRQGAVEVIAVDPRASTARRISPAPDRSRSSTWNPASPRSSTAGRWWPIAGAVSAPTPTKR